MRIFRWISGMLVICALVAQNGAAQTSSYDGLNLGMGNLSRLSHAKTRSISPENLTGEKGKGGMATEGTGAEAARDLGQGWKVSPCVNIGPKKVFTLAEIQGPGAIQHIWMTPCRPFAVLNSAHLLGWREPAFGRGSRRGFLCVWLGTVRSGLVAGGVCESWQRA